jgi:hypothetical protein
MSEGKGTLVRLLRCSLFNFVVAWLLLSQETKSFGNEGEGGHHIVRYPIDVDPPLPLPSATTSTIALPPLFAVAATPFGAAVGQVELLSLPSDPVPKSPMSSGSNVDNDSNSRPQRQNEVNYHHSSRRHHTTTTAIKGIAAVAMSDDEHAISVEAVCQRYETHLGNGCNIQLKQSTCSHFDN